LFFNANQATPTDDPNADFASRRPIPQIDGFIAEIQSEGRSRYDIASRFVRKKRFSHGLTFLAAWTWAHSLDLGLERGPWRSERRRLSDST
jgi:hypothetical protein